MFLRKVGAPGGIRTRNEPRPSRLRLPISPRGHKKRVCQGANLDRPRVERTGGANPYPWVPRWTLRTMADPGSTITRTPQSEALAPPRFATFGFSTDYASRAIDIALTNS